MNKRGQVIFYSLMVASVIIILALAFAPIVMQFTDDARNETTRDGANGMNCSSATLSPFDNAACITVDSFNWGFLGILIFIAIAYLGAKIIYEQ